jgi:chromosome segregation ATPase
MSTPTEFQVPLEAYSQNGVLNLDPWLKTKQEQEETLRAALNEQRATTKTQREETKELKQKHRKDIKTQPEQIEELKQKHRKELAELEAGIRPREVDVKVREDAVKVKEEELKAQSRRTTNEGKESGKELKLAKAQWEKQLKLAEDKVARLEGEPKSANDKYNILKLDYDGVLSELDTLKIKLDDQKPSDKVKNAFLKIKEERDRFKGLYEAARTDEPIIKEKSRTLFGLWQQRRTQKSKS